MNLAVRLQSYTCPGAAICGADLGFRVYPRALNPVTVAVTHGTPAAPCFAGTRARAHGCEGKEAARGDAGKIASRDALQVRDVRVPGGRRRPFKAWGFGGLRRGAAKAMQSSTGRLPWYVAYLRNGVAYAESGQGSQAFCEERSSLHQVSSHSGHSVARASWHAERSHWREGGRAQQRKHEV